MKKLFLIFAAVLLMVILTGCDNGPAADPPAETLQNVVETPESDNTDEETNGYDDEDETPAEYDYVPVVLAPMTLDFAVTTATQRTADIGIGWNLGNTLDAWGDEHGWHWMGGGLYENTTVSQMETAWVGARTTQGLIDAVRAAGFDTLRIPVTWFKAATGDNFEIREDWMNRVHEVVGYAVANDMYIILNTHHDETIFRFLDRYMDDSIAAFRRIWEQIAYSFRDYNDRLMFQGLNEPRTRGSAGEWSGGTAEERANINIYNQVFVDTVRASGGNNAERILMITTHAASSISVAQRALEMPVDTVEDRIVVNLHIYAPYEFALHRGSPRVREEWMASRNTDTDPITTPLNLAYELFVSQGIPVIITEFGALNRGNNPYRVDWAEFYVGHAASLGMPVVWWDNGEYQITAIAEWGGWIETFGLICRSTYEIMHPDVVDALMRSVR